MNISVRLLNQEMEGNYKFGGTPVYTRGFEAEFGDNTFAIIFLTIAKIDKLVRQNIADYFQVAYACVDGKEVKFYVIDDVDHFTFLLPEEY